MRGVPVRKWRGPCLKARGGKGGRVAQGARGVGGRRGGDRKADGTVSFPAPVLIGREVGGVVWCDVMRLAFR